MTRLRHPYSRRFIAGLFFAVTLLVPLKAVFACVMMDQVVEQCCCEQACKADCQPQQYKADNCCDSIYLSEAKLYSLSTLNKALTGSQSDDPQLPPALPPREVGPDPPVLSNTDRSTYLSIPPVWLKGSQTYLLTLRLRN
jgi:hypothetical protein